MLSVKNSAKYKSFESSNNNNIIAINKVEAILALYSLSFVFHHTLLLRFMLHLKFVK